jgi:probable rRNA maturation factor
MRRPVMRVVTATPAAGWTTAWRAGASQSQAVISAAAEAAGLTTSVRGVVEIEFTSDAAIQALNMRFRGKDKATNVLSFPNPSQPFGSIAVALETVQREAEAQGKPFLHHVKHMILHGFLHLIGHDHEIATERRLMESLEIRILGDMGIPNPYLLAK